MRKEIDQSVYDQVGHIRIKESKKKKKDKQKENKKETLPLWQKILIWSMFIAMLAAFIAPLVYYFINAISAE